MQCTGNKFYKLELIKFKRTEKEVVIDLNNLLVIMKLLLCNYVIIRKYCVTLVRFYGDFHSWRRFTWQRSLLFQIFLTY